MIPVLLKDDAINKSRRTIGKHFVGVEIIRIPKLNVCGESQGRNKAMTIITESSSQIELEMSGIFLLVDGITRLVITLVG